MPAPSGHSVVFTALRLAFSRPDCGDRDRHRVTVSSRPHQGPSPRDHQDSCDFCSPWRGDLPLGWWEARRRVDEVRQRRARMAVLSVTWNEPRDTVLVVFGGLHVTTVIWNRGTWDWEWWFEGLWYTSCFRAGLIHLGWMDFRHCVLVFFVAMLAVLIWKGVSSQKVVLR